MEIFLALALKSLLIAAVTLALLHLTRARSAAERSWIAHLGLFALVALPLASVALPALHLKIPAALTSTPDAIGPVALEVDETQLPPVIATDTVEPASALASIDWTPYAYAIPAVALLLITMLALLRLFALRHRAQVLVDPTWLSALAHAQRRMGFKNGTALLISNELSSPISWGLMRPVILLNDEALEARGEAEAIIAHELAHVARFDWAKLMLARVATAIFWFNPLAWMLAREAHQLREEAADDAVLAANIVETDYAQLLVGIARHECKGLLLGAHGVAPGKGSLRRRVGRVLDSTLARGPAQRSWVAGFAAGMLVMAAPLAALTFAPKDELPEDTLIGRDMAEASSAPATASVAPTTELVAGTEMSAVTETIAGHPDRDWTLTEEIARDVRIEADKARDEAREARRMARLDRKSPIDRAIEMKIHGVTSDYIAAIRAAAPQLRNLDASEFVDLKVKGVTPQYIRALVAAGYSRETADQIGDAAVMGVTATYIADLAAAGYRGIPLDELIEMRTLGVNRRWIEQFRRAGHTGLSPDQLVKLRTHGVEAADIELRKPPRPPRAAPQPLPAPARALPH